MSTGTHPILPAALDTETKTLGPVSRIAALLSTGVLEAAAFNRSDRALSVGTDTPACHHECVLTFCGPGIPSLNEDADVGTRHASVGHGETVTSAAAAALDELERYIAKTVARYSQYCTWVDQHRTRFVGRVSAARDHLPGLVLDEAAAP